MTVAQLKAALVGVADTTPVFIRVVVPGGTSSISLVGYTVVGTELQKPLESITVQQGQAISS